MARLAMLQQQQQPVRSGKRRGGAVVSRAAGRKGPNANERRGGDFLGDLGLAPGGGDAAGVGFYSFVSEEQVRGPGFVIYRYEAHLERSETGASASEAALDPSQYDYLEGRCLNDTQFLLEQSKLPALWSPPATDDDDETETAKDAKEEEEESSRGVTGGSYSKRRTKQLSFTCKICGTRMDKMINPHAWANGTIVIKCEGCGVKHELVDNLGVFDLLKKKPDPSKRRWN